MNGMTPSSPGVSARMSRQASKDTAVELAVRRLLHAAGLRYRVEYPVPGLPRRRIDVAFPRAKVAVLIDGCFWHGCPDHQHVPKRNTAYWIPKLQANRDRDRRVDAALVAGGWQVIRIWEHEDLDEAAERVSEAWRRAGSGDRRTSPI